jgi:hypothetical protein
VGLAFTGSVELSAPDDAVFAVVSDLTTYPSWLGIVQRVEPDPVGDGWLVDIGARMGFLSRSKRVRMERTAHEAPSRSRWERCELDGRPHPAWVLEAALDGGRLTMHLSYDGGMSLPGIELLLREEVRRAGRRLEDLVSRQ